MKSFSKNLKQIRLANNMSQKEFAEKLNTNQQRVSEWECDKIEPTLSSIVKIVQVLGVTFEDLIE